ncbi:MAG: substrate-binding domain-containing protein [Pseudomonadota bacterium]
MSVFFNPVEAESILLQSTTSTKNSGLYDHLLPRFSSDTGITVNVVAVGTGQALRNARNGDADVLLVHAREAEEAFVRDGFGVERFDLMYNDFVIVGPRADPADIRNSTNAGTALQKISASGSLFTSRGDDSGTHKKERMLWQQSGIDVDIHSGSWYRETGSGMGATLNIAIGLGAYALTDRATWISFENKHDFTIHVEGDQRLHNQYGVILVNPDKHLHVKQAAAQTFIDWLLSSAGQSSIAGYKLDGEQLFFPNASR